MSTVALCNHEWDAGLHGCALELEHHEPHTCDCGATPPPTGINMEPGVLEAISAILAVPGWTATPDTTWRGQQCLRLRQGPRGRGHRRETYTIVADTQEDCRRALAAVQEKLK